MRSPRWQWPYDDESTARSALAIAETLGDLDLRCIALSTLFGIADSARDFDRACAVMDQVMALLPGLPNPDVAPRHSTPRSLCT